MVRFPVGEDLPKKRSGSDRVLTAEPWEWVICAVEYSVYNILKAKNTVTSSSMHQQLVKRNLQRVLVRFQAKCVCS